MVVLPRGINVKRPKFTLQDKIMAQLVRDDNFKDKLITDIIIIKDSNLDNLNHAHLMKNKIKKLCKKVGYPCTLKEIDILLDQQQITNEEHRSIIKLINLTDTVLEVNSYEN